jgi:hypothetical protein
MLQTPANFWLALAGFLDVQFIHIRRLDSDLDPAVCLKFQITR